MSKKLKVLEEAVLDILSKDKGGRRLTAADIMAMVDEVAQERVQAEREAGVQRKPVRRVRHFGFDVAELQKRARHKMLKEDLDWADVWAQTGITVAPLKQHLGEEPPAAMGLGVATALMAWTGELDLVAFLLES
jgi:hypothetical protein